MLSDSRLLALGGGPLAEGNLVRLIYTDEAGTSAHEPVCVVATVIVHGDDQWRVLQSEMQRIVKEKVPVALQEGFVIHATEIFSGGKKINRDEWKFEDRLDFLKEIVCLPFIHDVPISVGIEFKGEVHAELAGRAANAPKKSQRLTANAWAHLMAFNTAMERADLFLRKYLDGKEIGTVVCEDVDRMREALKKAGLSFRDTHLDSGPDGHRPNRLQRQLGISPDSITYQIDHIIDVPNFVIKGKAPLLQLADACAFSFRHCLSRRPHGDDLVLAMLGPHQGASFIADKVWFEGASSGLFNTHSYWNEEQRVKAANLNLAAALRWISGERSE